MHKLQTNILKQLEQRSQTYSELYKSLQVRSNRFNYHLKRLQANKLVTKDNERYYLTTLGEAKMPYLDLDKESQPISVVILKINYNKELVLVKREKEAFQGYFGMPGGRIKRGKNINQTIQYTLKRETGLDLVTARYLTTIQETVVEEDLIKHHFIFLLYEVEATGMLTNGASYSELPNKMIPSDTKMLKLSDERFATSVMRYDNGKLLLESFSAD